MLHRILPLAILLGIAGCGKQVGEEPPATGPALIQGELTESSYRESASKALSEAVAALTDPTLTEEKLDKNLAQLEAIVGLESKLNVDKSKLSDAELMSTLGAMYTRKAGFHSDNGEQASAYVASGYRYLDRAIIRYPTNITARINRGITSANVPEFMNKTEVARDDLQFVVASPDFVLLTPELQARVKSVLHEVEGRLAPRAIHN